MILRGLKLIGLKKGGIMIGVRRSIQIFLCAWSIFTYVKAEIFFSNKESRVHVTPSAQLKLNAAVTGWQGTLKLDPGSLISGSNITFNNGALETQQRLATLKGTLDPSGANKILLQGGDILHAEPGAIVQIVAISGASNRIEGQPTFNTPLTLFDAATTLTLAIQKKLNNDINLSGGLLFLDDDLRLGEGVQINGPGTLQFNQAGLELSGNDGAWTSSVNFMTPDSISLNTYLALSGVWTFIGRSHLNGQGNVLDLSMGGQLVIAAGTELGISDIKIRGIGATSIVFMDPTSQVRLSDVKLELDDNYSMTLGGIFIDGSVTFHLKDHNFLVDNLASITFDGVRGFVDSLDFQQSTAAGQLQLPLPIFVDHVFNSTNFTANLTSGNLTILSSATISESMGSNDIFMSITYITNSTINIFTGSFSATTSYLFSGNVITGTGVTLDDTFWAPVGKQMIIGSDFVLDGSGNAIFFAHGDEPQIIVLPGNSLTLQNIELGRVNQTTFNIPPTAQLFIGENVQFELNQNLTFSQGQIIFTGDARVLNVRGIGGPKTLTFQPTAPGQTSVLNLGSSTIMLQDVEISGLQYITHAPTVIDGNIVDGAIGLAGRATANIDRSTDMNFFIQGLDNRLRILRNNLTLSGALLFGDAVDNQVHLDFALTDGLVPANRISFGDNFAYLLAESGKAGMVFDDFSVEVINLGSNSFVMDAGSYLDGFNLFVGTFPIKQLSNDIGLSNGLILSTDQANAIDPSFARNFLSGLRHDRPLTAVHLQRGLQKATKKDLIGTDIQKLFFGTASQYTRAIITPMPVTTPVGVGASLQLEDAFGTVKMERGSTLFDFGVDPVTNLNLILTDECTVSQGDFNTAFKAIDAIYVLGRGNVIQVTAQMQIFAPIYFEDGAELIFECVDRNNGKDPVLYFGHELNPAEVTLVPGSRLIFRGDGDVLFAPGSVIRSTARDIDVAPELQLRDSIEFGLQDVGELNVTGNLAIELDNEAELFVGSGHQINFGTDISRVRRDTMSFVVDRSSRIRLDGSRASRRAPFASAGISIAGINASILFDRGSQLEIGSSGLFELNARNDEEVRTNLTGITFGTRTGIAIDTLGTFALGPNNYDRRRRAGTTINWDLQQATISGDGRFKVVETNIYGRPRDLHLVTNATAPEIVRAYVNRAPNLITAIYFQDFDGNYYLRTRTGVIVPLTVNEDDLKEDLNTGVVQGVDRGFSFIINVDGSRG